MSKNTPGVLKFGAPGLASGLALVAALSIGCERMKPSTDQANPAASVTTKEAKASAKQVAAGAKQVDSTQVKYRTVEIDRQQIFYREAGSPNAPTILLLHGFPTSSHMFRNLIPALADQFHLVAPDYPGYGNSSMPAVDEFEYTFDNLARIIEKFTVKLGLKKYSVYLMDYGAPIGFRLVAK